MFKLSSFKMENYYNSNLKLGKLPTKSIDIVEKCVSPNNNQKSYPENMGKPIISTDFPGMDNNLNNRKIYDDSLLSKNFLENFKPKTDIILLKLLPNYHPLSAEQQAYFIKITEGIFGYNEQIRNEMLKVLAVDCNIREIVPYLCIFIKETIQCNIVFADLTLLIYSVRITKSLLCNNHIDLRPYLHEILPAVLSCALAKKISKYHYDNHWTLREFSAYIIGMICNIYGNDTNNITLRVMNIYKRPISVLNKPLTTLYGAIKGLGSLGEESVKKHILPNLPLIGRRLYAVLERNNYYVENCKQQITEAKHVRDAVLNIVCPILLKTRNIQGGSLQYMNEFGYLGDAIYMQMSNLERIESDRRQNPYMRIRSCNQNTFTRGPNFSLTLGYIPRMVPNFGMKYNHSSF